MGGPAFVEDDEEELELEELVRLVPEVLRAPLESAPGNGVGVIGLALEDGRALDDVLVDPEGLVGLPEDLLESLSQGATLSMVEALGVDAAQPEDNADGAGLGEEGVVVYEAPEGKDAGETR
jgi:hypothetical protein